MKPRNEIDGVYKEIMAQEERSTSYDELLNRMEWIKQIKPDIRQVEIDKLSLILCKELQRFSSWEEIKSKTEFVKELSGIIDMIAITEYVEGMPRNAYTECFRFLYHLSEKANQNNVSDVVQQYWIFQDIIPMIKGIFLLEKEDGTKKYPIYEMVIGMARGFKCDNNHLLNLAIALQMFEKVAQYAKVQESEEIKRAISEIAKKHNIAFLSFLIDGGKLMYDELDYKMNGTLIVKKNSDVIIRNIRRDYFDGYFKENNIISENHLAWYVKVKLDEDEEVIDIASILEDKNQDNKLNFLKMIEESNVYNVFIPNRILRNKKNQKITGFLNPASTNDKVIVYKQKTVENDKNGFLKVLHSGEGELRGCSLFKDDYDVITVDFWAVFYLEVVKNRWDFCVNLEMDKDCFYQEFLMKKYLCESLKKADWEEATDILDDFYNFIIQYFDFDKMNDNSMMDGKILAFPMINGYQKILSDFFSEENIKKRTFGEATDEWECEIAKYQRKKRKWILEEKEIRESDLFTTDFVNIGESNMAVPQRDLHVFVSKTDKRIIINAEFMDVDRKIKKLSEISKSQIIMYNEKNSYMDENKLSKLLKLIEANDNDHNKDEMFRCESRGRNNIYLYKALWHFQIYEMNKERVNKFWRLILEKHYLGMVEKTEIIKNYFLDMQQLADEDGILVMAKESYGNNSTLNYLYNKFKHVHGERSYLSWAFDAGSINKSLEKEENTNIILWRGKPLKKIIFMVDNLMKGGSLGRMLKFHLNKQSGLSEKRDYLTINPTVDQILAKNPNLQIEVHPIFGFRESAEKIENEYSGKIKITIHEDIPEEFHSDSETIDLVSDLYDKKADLGICCVFRYNNLPAKNVLPKNVCDYRRRVGLFQRSADLV